MAGIEFSVTTDEDLGEIVGELRQFNSRLQRNLARQIVPRAEREIDRIIETSKLREEPPPRNPQSTKFVWSLDRAANLRARRWFFKHFPKGYRRTGALAKNWRGVIRVEGNVVYIEIRNDSRGASYVYGSQQFGYRRVISHARTGWYNSRDRVPQAVNTAAEFVENRLDEYVDDQIKKL